MFMIMKRVTIVIIDKQVWATSQNKHCSQNMYVGFGVEFSVGG